MQPDRHSFDSNRLRIILLTPAVVSLLAGCPWNNSSNRGEEGEEANNELRMLFNTECASSTCFIDTGATYDNNDNVAQIVCDMGDGNIINVEQVELHFDYTYDAPGDYDVTCIVTDMDGLTDTSSRSILVTGLFANAGPDRTVAEGQDIILDGSGSVDESGNGLTYRWGRITGPTGFYLNDSTIESPTFTAPAVEENTVFIYSLRVDNGIEDSVTDTVSITVLETDFTDLPQ